MAREVTLLVMRNEYLAENQRLKCAAESIESIENFVKTKLELDFDAMLTMENPDKTFSPVTSADQLPAKIRVKLAPKVVAPPEPQTFTLLVMQNDLVLQNRKVVVDALDFAELVNRTTATVAASLCLQNVASASMHTVTSQLLSYHALRCWEKIRYQLRHRCGMYC